MSDQKQLAYSQAIRDFRHARERATLEIILDRIQGQPSDLLSYEDVRRKLHARSTAPRGLQEIPLDSIVGSVGRYSDFTRSFLPRDKSAAQRWARVKALTEGMEGLPPIEVYQIGDVYFVRDGHHRVSVAREVGATSIEAYVTEVKARVSLSPEDDPRQLIIKEEYTEFLEATELDQLRPEAEIILTEPGKYPHIKAQIDFHHQIINRQFDEQVDYQQSVVDWYERVYGPIVQTIRRQGILREFPGRTEADLYLWIIQYREALEKHLGWEIGADQAAADLAEQYSERPARRVEKLGGQLLSALIPEGLESGPPVGDWRREVVSHRQEERLFRDILVAIRNDDDGWRTLEQAIRVAKHERSRILGLHVAPLEEAFDEADARRMSERFEANCHQQGLQARFVIDQGEVPSVICRRARWADLVVLSLKHPPAEARLARLGSGLRRLIRSCPRPVLLVPDQPAAQERTLIAYDGSPKAQEALFIGTYMASAWEADLLVLTVHEESVKAEQIQKDAWEYLEHHGVSAEMRIVEGPAADGILDIGRTWGADFILIGGYGATPMLEVVLGSTVDEVLRRSRKPLLVCR